MEQREHGWRWELTRWRGCDRVEVAGWNENDGVDDGVDVEQEKHRVQVAWRDGDGVTGVQWR